MSRKALLVSVLGSALLGSLGFLVLHAHRSAARAQVPTTLQVAVVYDRNHPDSTVRDAYESVLREEGLPHRWVAWQDVLGMDAAEQLRAWQAVVFPDGIVASLPPEMGARMEQFAKAGGAVAIVFDAGARDMQGAWRPSGVFAALLGVEYIQYAALRDGAYGVAPFRFASAAAAARWQIPAGKLDPTFAISGYGYGALSYSQAVAHATSRDLEVYASTPERGPTLATRPVGSGLALWVDLPLGALKADGDDLPLRAVLRTFVEDLRRTPHLVPAPAGVGGLVVNWHIDSNADIAPIPLLLSEHLIRPELRYEFDVTAGPDARAPGDGLGFDACGKSEATLKMLLPYGIFGWHGGWAHDWLAHGLDSGELDRAQVEHYVQINNDCIQKISGQPVVSYAAPVGVHPQPWFTEMLLKMGIHSYYYTGDSGAPPNRTFYKGAMVSPVAWAYPVMPNGRDASLYEMSLHQPAAATSTWLHQTVDYVVANRTVRLVYSHPHDLATDEWRRMYGAFLDYVVGLQRAGRLQVQPMPWFTAFFSRFVQAEATFTMRGDALEVELRSPASLKDVCVAVPADLVTVPATLPSGLEVRHDGAYEAFIVQADLETLHLSLPLR